MHKWFAVLAIACTAAPAAAESLPVVPHTDEVAVLTVIEQDTFLTKVQTRLYLEPRVGGFKKVLLPGTQLFPTGRKAQSGKWIEVRDEYSKYIRAGEVGWVRFADVILFTEWQGR